MKGVVTFATEGKISLKNVFAYMQKKMRYWKQEGKELGGIASFIVTRRLHAFVLTSCYPLPPVVHASNARSR